MIDRTPYIGLPKTAEIKLAWTRAIRGDPSLMKYKKSQVSTKIDQDDVGSSIPPVLSGDKTPSSEVKILSPYEVLGVSPEITPELLSDIIKKGGLTKDQEKAIQQIQKERRKKRKSGKK